MEDLSVYSRDQETLDNSDDLLNGTRASIAFVRPYAMRVSGVPTSFNFNYKTHFYKLEFNGNDNAESPTIIFLPKNHYKSKEDIVVETSGGEWSISNDDKYQRMFLEFHHDKNLSRHWISVAVE